MHYSQPYERFTILWVLPETHQVLHYLHSRLYTRNVMVAGKK